MTSGIFCVCSEDASPARFVVRLRFGVEDDHKARESLPSSFGRFVSHGMCTLVHYTNVSLAAHILAKWGKLHLAPGSNLRR